MAKQTFEEKIEKIEQIISELESGASSLDESVKLYNSGMNLAQECQKELDEAVLKVKKIGGGEKEEHDG